MEKLHKMAFIIFFFIFLKKFEKIEKKDYHSNFNFEFNTERGFKESLSIALGSYFTPSGNDPRPRIIHGAQLVSLKGLTNIQGRRKFFFVSIRLSKVVKCGS